MVPPTAAGASSLQAAMNRWKPCGWSRSCTPTAARAPASLVIGLVHVWGATRGHEVWHQPLSEDKEIAEGRVFAVFLSLRGEQEDAIRRSRAALVREPYSRATCVALGSHGSLTASRPRRSGCERVVLLRDVSARIWARTVRRNAFNLGRRAEARAELDEITGPLGQAANPDCRPQLLPAVAGTQSRPGRGAFRPHRDAR